MSGFYGLAAWIILWWFLLIALVAVWRAITRHHKHCFDSGVDHMPWRDGTITLKCKCGQWRTFGR